MKALGAVVLDGAQEVRRQLEAWRATGSKLRLPGNLDDGGGYIGSRTPLLDAIELLDLHVRLEPDARRGAADADQNVSGAEGMNR